MLRSPSRIQEVLPDRLTVSRARRMLASQLPVVGSRVIGKSGLILRKLAKIVEARHLHTPFRLFQREAAVVHRSYLVTQSGQVVTKMLQFRLARHCKVSRNNVLQG